MKVMLGIPAHRDFPAATVISLLETVQHCEAVGIELTPCIVSDCSIGAFAARNLVSYVFLNTNCTHIFWLDSDMVWTATDFVKLLGHDYPFVGAAGPTKEDKPRLAGYDDCIGLCFACVQRKVMMEIASIRPLVKFQGRLVPQIFHTGVIDGKLLGEDIGFCKDVQSLGYVINIDHSIRLGHIGQKEYRL